MNFEDIFVSDLLLIETSSSVYTMEIMIFVYLIFEG